MNWLNKLEKKIGTYAVPNLTNYVIGTYVVGYLLLMMYPQIINEYFTLNPHRILQGEVWRVVTWLLVPPDTFNFFTIIMLFLYYTLGHNLERTWGTFRYNAYILGGILLTVIGAFALYGVYEVFSIMDNGIVGFDANKEVLGQIKDMNYSHLFATFSTYYINLSIFLAFAANYPDMQLMLYFVIPVKIKWLAYLQLAFLAMTLISINWGGRVAIIVSLLNFIIFYLSSRNYRHINPKNIKRRRTYSNQVKNLHVVSKHKCAVCGRTDDDIEYRFCSKCNGNYEYCKEHLFNHNHVN